MRILHLISSGGMYGAEAVILDLSRCLRRAGHEPLLGVFANSRLPNTELETRARAEGLETHVLPCRGQLDKSVLSRLRELVEATRADVVHCHGYKADVYAFLALRSGNIPIVATCHTWYDNDFMVRFYGKLDRFVLRHFQGVVAVSEEVRQQLFNAGIAENRICMIHNGVDDRELRAINRISESDSEIALLKVGLVGRLAPEKGVDVFLRAAKTVLAQLPETRFFVAGDGPDRQPLENLLGQLDLKDCAFLLGRTEKMTEFYASLDLLVSASRQEGLPIALLEGMASGLAVVATRAGEVPAVVEDGVTGRLVATEDPEALATTIVGLLRDRELRYKMGHKGRNRIQTKFSADRMTVDYVRLYENAALRKTGLDLKSGRLDA